MGPRGADDPAPVRGLLRAVREADGVAAFGEASLLELDRGAGETLCVFDASVLVGAAHLPEGDGPAELAVHPGHRRRGWGRRLLGQVQDRAPQRAVWSHGRLPAAVALAAAAGYQEERVLLQLVRTLDDDLPAPVWPPGVTVRAFRPGVDDRAWLRANARAFAAHPEQGRWGPRELAERVAADWFDPTGFLLAVQDEELLGYHWTKRGPGDPHGEVYVLGVDPAAQGRRLGPALLLAGLAHLRADGAAAVDLYVEGDNDAALALYRRHGFTERAVDVTYRLSR